MCKVMMQNTPLPPPLPDKLFRQETVRKSFDISFKDSSLCAWAAEELKIACIRNGICLDKPPSIVSNRNFTSLLQEGPTCGLVALLMLLDKPIKLLELLVKAKELGFTNNGEMLSVKNMLALCNYYVDIGLISHFRFRRVNGHLNDKEIIMLLISGHHLLVPYDSDFDHRPCLKKGHKAHWALITGIVVIDKTEPINKNPDNIYVFAKHGKSLHLAAWQLKSLDSSNSNLEEFSTKRSEDGLIYVLPEGGLSGKNGLKNQFLIVEKLS